MVKEVSNKFLGLQIKFHLVTAKANNHFKQQLIKLIKTNPCKQLYFYRWFNRIFSYLFKFHGHFGQAKAVYKISTFSFKKKNSQPPAIRLCLLHRTIQIKMQVSCLVLTLKFVMSRGQFQEFNNLQILIFKTINQAQIQSNKALMKIRYQLQLKLIL
ncbi:hypothetical protein TTHERM_000821835 (macronuclear) [Tetrahymena thermophila SB210]|uniref:Uncharacterized protein n=1 Tax=Tetrahymena thermophila (strain SB210) TaxID=312017 RepID=W7X0N1_TETTS|nr:hypothetical protein TTHERM_000821835 [Tetrahymena thermophila SB210]EWS72710.1 hypothetical protein TTHERM_000821835 [Tetrahymena thermophila SB210]|eukprot:XP_012654752.1 hypothetical protein TTHERM_000821835 [Tetrahymena thermophila SB210]